MTLHRPLILLLLSFGMSSRLESQQASIGARPSVLFANSGTVPSPSDSTTVDRGISRRGGAMLGMVLGGALGYFLSGFSNGGDATCDLAGPSCSGGPSGPSDRVRPALFGALVGVIVGDVMAEH